MTGEGNVSFPGGFKGIENSEISMSVKYWGILNYLACSQESVIYWSLIEIVSAIDCCYSNLKIRRVLFSGFF